MAAYDDPAGIIAGSVVMWVLALTSVALRFYSMRWRHQKLTTSEWLILVAFIFGTGLTVMEIYGVAITALAYPLGETLLDPYTPGSRLNKTKHIQLAFLMLGIATTGLIKLSVCFLYWNLFGKVRSLRYFLMFYIMFIAAWTVSFVAAGLAQCGNHLKAVFGYPTEYLAHCGHAVPTGYALVGTDVATDFITLMIPIPVILRLQMSTRTKLLTILTFMIGALAIGGSIAKAYIYVAGSKGQYVEDAILLITGLSVWNLMEVQIGIIAACGPTLRQILGRILPSSESLRYLISRISGSHPTGKDESSELPSFVKMADSAEHLHHPGQISAKRSREQSGESARETELGNGNQVRPVHTYRQ